MFFEVPPQPVTDAAIHTNFISDLYAVLGEPDGNGGYITRIYHKPLVPWIFLGAVVMAFGGGVSLTDRRHRIGTPKRAKMRETSRSNRDIYHSRTLKCPFHYVPYPFIVFAILSGFFSIALR